MVYFMMEMGYTQTLAAFRTEFELEKFVAQVPNAHFYEISREKAADWLQKGRPTVTSLSHLNKPLN